MKPITIVGNWKSNKTIDEAQTWLESFEPPSSGHTIILCAPFTLLNFLHEQKPAFALGAQDVSPFGQGAYTGEVSAKQLKEFVEWVIIGHSERRKYLHESDEELSFEVLQAKHAGLNVVFCVPDASSHVPAGVDIVAYEPVEAIGTGRSEDPKQINAILSDIKKRSKALYGLYGGSVTPENVASFIKEPSIDGVLVGGASLDAVKFSELIANASNT